MLSKFISKDFLLSKRMITLYVAGIVKLAAHFHFVVSSDDAIQLVNFVVDNGTVAMLLISKIIDHNKAAKAAAPAA